MTVGYAPQADFGPGSSKGFPPRDGFTTNVEVDLQIMVGVFSKNT
jgi:hypothetical protein